MTATPELYGRHLATLDAQLQDALARANKRGVRARAVLFHAGRPGRYHRDDQDVAFRPDPYFARYVPLAGPEHCVFARPAHKPLVVRVAPRDYWYEVTPLSPSSWQSSVELAEVESFAAVRDLIGSLTDVAYVGNSREAAAELGIPADLCEPEAVLRPLDWHRAVKTEYEQALLAVAAERGAAGHRAARQAFVDGACEREIHWKYLEATRHLEQEMPFETIVAFDAKSATLHYQNKRGIEARARHTFLLDAGAQCETYASDITRTWLRRDADPTFAALLHGLDELQRDLVAMVTPGRPYLEIHLDAHRRVARLLADTHVVRCSAAEAFDRGITRTFLPHGVGHHLGLQVHDIGGHQAEPDGGRRPPPPEYPSLRNTRTLAPGHYVTIEPGIYFIPVLLEALRAAPAGAAVDWQVVERLMPLGGMRIEDDILCTEAGPRDFTRPLIDGPRDWQAPA